MTAPELALSGDDTVRITNSEVKSLRQISEHLRQSEDWLEVVDGISDVTVQFNPLTLTPDEAIQKLKTSMITAFSSVTEALTERELFVLFGGEEGPDLQNVCDRLSISESELIEQLCSADLYVDMMGFTPGFAYIGGVPEGLFVPRLTEPRKHVPAGSLGLAAGRCGTYALPGPGGWPLIGKVQTPLFDAHAEMPFLIRAGMPIRLRAVARS